MKKFIRFTAFLLFCMFLTSCKTSLKKETPTTDMKIPQDNQMNQKKSTMEVRVSCGEGEISKFIDEGWVIVEEFTEEKICTWKSFPATKTCDMEKDKGCKITKPDKIGEEKIYLLEK